MIDELDRLGIRDNTIVIYIFGDNGASAEGQNGTISELLAQNGIPNTVEQQLAALDKIGGLDALGAPEDRQHVPRRLGVGRQHAVPIHQADRLAFRRHAQPDGRSRGRRASSPIDTPRSQFHHVNDIVPTIYEIVGIKPPKVVDGFVQDPIDGVSLAYTFDDAKAPTRKKVQYFDNNGSRAHLSRRLDRGDLRSAGAVAARRARPRGVGFGQGQVGTLPDHQGFLGGQRSRGEGTASVWRSCRRLFDEQAKANKVYPLGAGIWLRLHPEDRIKTPYTSWQFDATTTRMPEFTAPGLGRESNTVTIDAEIGENASGVLYALGGAGGGLTLYMDKGQLVYEYNMMIIERYIARSTSKIAPGKQRIEVDDAARKPEAAVPGKRRAEGRWAGGRAHDGQAHRARAPSRRARPSTSASTSVRPCRSTTSTGARSASTARSKKST